MTVPSRGGGGGAGRRGPPSGGFSDMSDIELQSTTDLAMITAKIMGYKVRVVPDNPNMVAIYNPEGNIIPDSICSMWRSSCPPSRQLTLSHWSVRSDMRKRGIAL